MNQTITAAIIVFALLSVGGIFRFIAVMIRRFINCNLLIIPEVEI